MLPLICANALMPLHCYQWALSLAILVIHKISEEKNLGFILLKLGFGGHQGHADKNDVVGQQEGQERGPPCCHRLSIVPLMCIPHPSMPWHMGPLGVAGSVGHPAAVGKTGG